MNQATHPLLQSIASADLGTLEIWQAWEAITADPSAVMTVGIEIANSPILERFPDLHALRHVPQGTEDHLEEDVWSHVWIAAFDAAAVSIRDGLSSTRRTVAVLAALTHDFLKPAAAELQRSGKMTSYDHEKVSVEPADSFLRQIGCPDRHRERILVLIRQHLRHVTLGGARPTHRAVRRLLVSLNTSTTGATFDDWARLVDAHTHVRGGTLQSPATAAWREVVKILSDRGVLRDSNGVVTDQFLLDNGITAHGAEGRALIALARQAEAAGAFTDRDGATAWIRRCGSTRGVRAAS